ncbi:MAG TPA: hypothetical protein VK113_02220 [Gemmatimonadales bacterium]|nr:hypothetical protein [Gemmatimonadales bacterium]
MKFSHVLENHQPRGNRRMSDLSVRVSAASARNVLTERDRRAAIAPMLPALLRGVIFLAGLAAPFVVALFAG